MLGEIQSKEIRSEERKWRWKEEKTHQIWKIGKMRERKERNEKERGGKKILFYTLFFIKNRRIIQKEMVTFTVWLLWNRLANLIPWGSWNLTAATSSDAGGSSGSVSFILNNALSLYCVHIWLCSKTVRECSFVSKLLTNW